MMKVLVVVLLISGCGYSARVKKLETNHIIDRLNVALYEKEHEIEELKKDAEQLRIGVCDIEIAY